MNGSSHDWKLTAISRYTSTTAKISPSPSRKNDVRMVVTWPRRSMRGAARQSLRNVAHDLLDGRANASQIAPVHVGIDVEDRLHVVVIHNLGRHAALHA